MQIVSFSSSIVSRMWCLQNTELHWKHCWENITYLHGFPPCTLYIPHIQCHPVVLIMSVFDLQLSLSKRDASQWESLPTTPCCAFKSEAEAATERGQGETNCGSWGTERVGKRGSGEGTVKVSISKVLIQKQRNKSQTWSIIFKLLYVWMHCGERSSINNWSFLINWHLMWGNYSGRVKGQEKKELCLPHWRNSQLPSPAATYCKGWYPMDRCTG